MPFKLFLFYALLFNLTCQFLATNIVITFRPTSYQDVALKFAISITKSSLHCDLIRLTNIFSVYHQRPKWCEFRSCVFCVFERRVSNPRQLLHFLRAFNERVPYAVPRFELFERPRKHEQSVQRRQLIRCGLSCLFFCLFLLPLVVTNRRRFDMNV